MAESVPLITSAVKDSDAELDIFCDPCHHLDGKFSEPAGYCTNCEEHLCQSCFSLHKRTKPTRNHLLEDEEHMPRSKHQGQPRVHTVDDKCHIHKAERVLYFCQSHNQLCCQLCVTITHRRCDTELISIRAANMDISTDCQTLKTEMTTLQKSFSSVLANAEIHASKNRSCHSTAIEDIDKLKKAFDELRNKKIDEADTILAEDSKKILSVNASCKVVMKEIDDAISGLDTYGDIQNKEAVFISMYRTRHQNELMKASLTPFEEDTKVREYSFLPDEKLRSMLNRLENIGTFSHEQKTPDIEAQKSKTPHHVKDIDVKCSDETSCCITGISVVSPNKLLIADNNNKNLKFIDIKQGTIISKLTLQDSPWTLAKVTDQRVAVTLTDTKKILFVTTSGNNLATEKELSVAGKCKGIAYNANDQTLIVTFFEPKKVDIMNLTGTVIKRINNYINDTTGAPIFAYPQYVAFDHRKSLIYVSDCNNNCVTSITLDRTVEKTYSNMIKSPEDLYVLQTGIVYVVGYRSKTIVKLVPGGDKFEPTMYLDNETYYPQAITYCEEDYNMFIGMGNACVVKQFQMKS